MQSPLDAIETRTEKPRFGEKEIIRPLHEHSFGTQPMLVYA